MITCDTCKGEGIVGQGDNPHLKLGRTETCPTCKGTGEVEENAAAAEGENGTPAEPVKPADDSTVDNTEKKADQVFG